MSMPGFQMVSAGLLGLAEQSLNRMLHQDPVTLDRLGQLAGKVIAIHATLPGFSLYLLPHSEGIDLLAHYNDAADVSLSGRAADLARLPLAGNEVLFGRGVELRGDSGVAHRLQGILADTRIDWEAWVSDLLGDAAGHEVAVCCAPWAATAATAPAPCCRTPRNTCRRRPACCPQRWRWRSSWMRWTSCANAPNGSKRASVNWKTAAEGGLRTA